MFVLLLLHPAKFPITVKFVPVSVYNKIKRHNAVSGIKSYKTFTFLSEQGHENKVSGLNLAMFARTSEVQKTLAP
jgi:hypothetical protein